MAWQSANWQYNNCTFYTAHFDFTTAEIVINCTLKYALCECIFPDMYNDVCNAECGLQMWNKVDAYLLTVTMVSMMGFLFHICDPFCAKPVVSRNIKFQEYWQKFDEKHFSLSCYIITDYNFNTSIYVRKHKTNLKGYYLMISWKLWFQIYLWCIFCWKLVSYIQIVFLWINSVMT